MDVRCGALITSSSFGKYVEIKEKKKDFFCSYWLIYLVLILCCFNFLWNRKANSKASSYISGSNATNHCSYLFNKTMSLTSLKQNPHGPTPMANKHFFKHSRN